MKSKTPRFLFLLCIFLGLFVLNISLGSVSFSFSDTFSAIIHQQSDDKTLELILFSFRIPKTFTAILAGASLAVAGLLMQSLFQNPLAGPFVLGISSGASLGVSICILLSSLYGLTAFRSKPTLLLASSLGSFLVFLAILACANRIKNNTTLLILGLMFGYISGGFVSVLFYFSQTEELNTFMQWSYGSFSRLTPEYYHLFAIPILLCLFASLLISKYLNAFLLGENYARSLGVSIKKFRLIIVFISASLAGIVTSFCGPISFIGVSAPHIARYVFHTSNHFVLVPASIIIGASVAILADIISGMPGTGYTLPLNSITSIIGAPILIWVILSKKKAL
ncbi:MAG: iron ABC transporter permease [Candidatus Cloacimonetes bacterium]|nr:iron ABC transporter permease [Candidatus Cloacimonadota bacterium]